MKLIQTIFCRFPTAMGFLPAFSYIHIFAENCFVVYSNFWASSHRYTRTHTELEKHTRMLHAGSMSNWGNLCFYGFCGFWKGFFAAGWVRAETAHTHSHTLLYLKPDLNGLNAFYGPGTFFNCQLNWATKLNKKCCSCCTRCDWPKRVDSNTSPAACLSLSRTPARSLPLFLYLSPLANKWCKKATP